MQLARNAGAVCQDSTASVCLLLLHTKLDRVGFYIKVLIATPLGNGISIVAHQQEILSFGVNSEAQLPRKVYHLSQTYNQTLSHSHRCMELSLNYRLGFSA